MNKANLAIALVGILISTASCLETDRDLYVKLTKDQYFDFNLNQEVALHIDYAFQAKDYVVLFDIYNENPLEEKADGTIGKKEIASLYRAATDGTGKFSGSFQLLADLSEVWLYSDYPGTGSPVKLEIKDGKISFQQDEYIASILKKGGNTRAVTPKKHTYPDGWLVLGDWDEYGTPDYLLPELATPPPSTLYSIKNIYSSTPVGGQYITERFPEFFDGTMTSDVKIIKPTKVNMAFVNSTASWNNAVGYFTYPTHQPPTSVKDIQKILAFPNASTLVKIVNKEPTRGALLCNHQVQLKYWDGKQFHDEFPAGISIGWFLEGMGFERDKGGNVVEKSSRYSIIALNSDKKQRTVSLKEKNSTQIIAVGFEDNTDMRYNDACFYLAIEEDGAIDPETPELPEVDPPTNIENKFSTFGTLTYEDLWPRTGDYDMNDVMIDYNCTVYKNIVGNRVYKIVDEFIPRHNGGTLETGFGYQLSSLQLGDIKSVTIEGETSSTYMEGQSLEPGQMHPTILLFDNIASVLQKKFTVTIELNDVLETNVIPPYNPFIFVESNKGRGKEVHLPKYRPTDKADTSLFGTEGDGSRPENDLYYVVSRWLPQMPYAIHLPSIKDFPIPEEFVPIDVNYPDFKKWIASDGRANKDWYKKPQK